MPFQEQKVSEDTSIRNPMKKELIKLSREARSLKSHRQKVGSEFNEIKQRSPLNFSNQKTSKKGAIQQKYWTTTAVIFFQKFKWCQDNYGRPSHRKIFTEVTVAFADGDFCDPRLFNMT